MHIGHHHHVCARSKEWEGMRVELQDGTPVTLGYCDNCNQGITHLGPTSDIRIHEIDIAFSPTGVTGGVRIRLCDQCFAEFQELIKEKLRL